MKKKNVMIMVGSLLLLAVFFVFALGSTVEQSLAARQEISWIEAGYVPAARCGRAEVMAEPVSLGLGQDRLVLVPAPGHQGGSGGHTRYPVAVVTAPAGAAARLAAANAAPGEVLLQPSAEPAIRAAGMAAPGLQADGPLNRAADPGRVYPVRVQVIYTGEAGPELPYPGLVRNLMSFFFDVQPGQEPTRPAAPAV